jgi:hypothetical protein
MRGDITLHLSKSQNGEQWSVMAFVKELSSKEEALEYGEVMKQAAADYYRGSHGPAPMRGSSSDAGTQDNPCI